ncbi:hypothetical protein K1W54_06815, partial [Micromonospora sp. CPCC 205371]|nr:hypothetical protein [Micromonospora sp. CPCC 205371]
RAPEGHPRGRKAQRGTSAALPAAVVDPRRQHVIDNALATIGQGRDVVMVWGPGHQPAMLADLAAHGFARTGPAVWHTDGALKCAALITVNRFCGDQARFSCVSGTG